MVHTTTPPTNASGDLSAGNSGTSAAQQGANTQAPSVPTLAPDANLVIRQLVPGSTGSAHITQITESTVDINVHRWRALQLTAVHAVTGMTIAISLTHCSTLVDAHGILGVLDSYMHLNLHMSNLLEVIDNRNLEIYSLVKAHLNCDANRLGAPVILRSHYYMNKWLLFVNSGMVVFHATRNKRD